jgi:hypothetical protein
MIELYQTFELSDNDLIEACEFTEDDLGNESQIDFIMVVDPDDVEKDINELPHYIRLHLKGIYTYHARTFRGVPKGIFIFWHD